MLKSSISRRAPTMPMPMPVSDWYRPASTSSRCCDARALVGDADDQPLRLGLLVDGEADAATARRSGRHSGQSPTQPWRHGSAPKCRSPEAARGAPPAVGRSRRPGRAEWRGSAGVAFPSKRKRVLYFPGYRPVHRPPDCGQPFNCNKSTGLSRCLRSAEPGPEFAGIGAGARLPRVSKPLNGESPQPGGFGLARVALRTAQDVVALSRRTRAAGEEFGLHPRSIRGLLAATYETARLLADQSGRQAEVRLSDGPSLQVVFRLVLDDPTAAGAAPLARLRGRRPAAHDGGRDSNRREARGVVDLPAGAVPDGRRRSLPCGRGAARGRRRARRPRGARRRRAARETPQLTRAYRDLQSELQETNRGVVALHTELEANADKLRQAEDRLRLLLDSVQDYAICMLTPHGEIASWNAGAERLFGYAADEIIGRSFALLLPGRRARSRRSRRASPQRRGARPVRRRVPARAARRRGRSTRTSSSRRCGAAASARSRASRWSFATSPSASGSKTICGGAPRSSSAANRAKEDFLATLSHELRTPLNAMLGWTRLLRMGKLDGAAMARALETIERNAHIQEQLIADILDVSRIVTGKLRLELRPMELAPVVDAALDAVRPAAAAKGVQLEADTNFHGTVLGDPDRLQQVVWNLAANAIKFTPAGGRVALHARRASARARSSPSPTPVRASAGAAAVHLRPFHAGRRLGHPAARRPRSRPLHRSPHRRAARRAGRGGERGARLRRLLLRAPAGARHPAADRRPERARRSR